MKVVIFLAAVSAANIFVAVEGFFPTSTISTCGINGYKISFGSNRGIQGFRVHLNINKPITVEEWGDTDIWIDKMEDGQWIFKNISANLKPGDKINYWTTVRFYEYYYDSTVKNFEVLARKGLVAVKREIVEYED